MRTNKASEKDPETGVAIRFKVDGNWYEGTFDGTDYIFPNGTRNAKDTVESWHRVKDTAPCAAMTSNAVEDKDTVKASRTPSVVDRGGFDLDTPSDTDGDGWSIYNSVREIYGLAPLPVPHGATVNSLSA